MRAVVSVAQAEALLHTEYFTWSHSSDTSASTSASASGAGASPLVRCRSYTLPPSLRSAVAFVQPTHHFPPKTASFLRQSQRAPSSDQDTVTRSNGASVSNGAGGVSVSSVAEATTAEIATPGILRTAYGVNSSMATIKNRSLHYMVVTEFDEEYVHNHRICSCFLSVPPPPLSLSLCVCVCVSVLCVSVSLSLSVCLYGQLSN